jgi:Spy/CpxP family protein refolding chaperone
LLPIFIYQYLIMKQLFLLLFSAIALSTAVQAQDSTTVRQRQVRGSAIRQQRIDVMQQLNLTDEQKAGMQKLREAQKVSIDSVRNSSLGDEEKMAQLKAIRESNRKAMQDLLTPEQRSKMQQMRAEQMEKRKAAKEETDSTR